MMTQYDAYHKNEKSSHMHEKNTVHPEDEDDSLREETPQNKTTLDAPTMLHGHLLHFIKVHESRYTEMMTKTQEILQKKSLHPGENEGYSYFQEKQQRHHEEVLTCLQEVAVSQHDAWKRDMNECISTIEKETFTALDEKVRTQKVMNTWIRSDGVSKLQVARRAHSRELYNTRATDAGLQKASMQRLSEKHNQEMHQVEEAMAGNTLRYKGRYIALHMKCTHMETEAQKQTVEINNLKETVTALTSKRGMNEIIEKSLRVTTLKLEVLMHQQNLDTLTNTCQKAETNVQKLSKKNMNLETSFEKLYADHEKVKSLLLAAHGELRKLVKDNERLSLERECAVRELESCSMDKEYFKLKSEELAELTLDGPLDKKAPKGVVVQSYLQRLEKRIQYERQFIHKYVKSQLQLSTPRTRPPGHLIHLLEQAFAQLSSPLTWEGENTLFLKEQVEEGKQHEVELNNTVNALQSELDNLNIAGESALLATEEKDLLLAHLTAECRSRREEADNLRYALHHVVAHPGRAAAAPASAAPFTLRKLSPRPYSASQVSPGRRPILSASATEARLRPSTTDYSRPPTAPSTRAHVRTILQRRSISKAMELTENSMQKKNILENGEKLKMDPTVVFGIQAKKQIEIRVKRNDRL